MGRFKPHRSFLLAFGGFLVAGVALFLLFGRPRPRPAEAAFLQEVRSRLGAESVLELEGRVVAKPEDAKARRRLAEACAAVGDPAGVVLALFPLAELRTDPDVLATYVRACCALGWLETAEQEVMRAGSVPAAVRLELAAAYARSGDRAAAARHLAALQEPGLDADQRLQAATLCLQLRQYPLAIDWARKALALRRDDPAARLLLVRCLHAAGRVDEARRLLSAPPSTEGSGPAPAQESAMLRAGEAFWRARLALAASQPAEREAGRRALAALAAQSGHPVAAFEAGRAELAAGRYRPAERLIRQALRAGYQDVLCYELLARAYVGLDRPREAAWARGKAWFLRGRLDRAEAAFTESLRLGPPLPDLARELARTLTTQGRYAEALAVLDTAQKTAAHDVDLALLKAAVLGRIERVDAQIRELERAVRLDPRRANEPLGELGKLYYNSQQFDRAIPVLRRAVETEPGDAYSHMYLGLAYARRPEATEQARLGVQHLLRAAAAAPEYFYPWTNAGMLLVGMGHLAEAGACFRRAIDGDSRWEGPYLSLAQVLQRQRRLAEGKLVLILYSRTRRLEQERSRLENEARREPQKAGARFALGDRLLRDGRPREAYPELLAAASLAPGWQQARERLADVCALLEFDDLRKEAEGVAE